MELPELGFYYHYKHDPKGEFSNYAYEVIGVGKHTEDETLFVVYKPLYDNSEFLSPAIYSIRPLSMFMENVEVNGKIIPRFQKITDPDLIQKLKEIKKEL